MSKGLQCLRKLLVAAVMVVFPAALAGCSAAVAKDGQHAGAQARETPRAADGPIADSPTADSPSLDRLPTAWPSAGEELWVIRRPALAPRRAHDDTPGSGSLLSKFGKSGRLVPVPLKHTDVKASIAGHVATVDVTQQFHNPYSTPIEAVYVFPLPHNGAVNEFVMTVGERRIRGVIRERNEADKIYREARALGYVTTLLTQDGPNTFAQSVANVEPGKRIDVGIRYFNTLRYSDGWYEFVFPMAAAPRVGPRGTAGGVVPARRRGRRGQALETAIGDLPPGERSRHDVALAVNLDAAVPVEAVESSTHEVVVRRPSQQRAEVELAAGGRIADRDFVLRWKVAGDGIKSGLIVHRDERRASSGSPDGGYFSLLLVPPEDLKGRPRRPVEVVFAVDASERMPRRSVERVNAAVRYALRNLAPVDTFQIVRLSATADAFAPRPLTATPENARRGLQFLDGGSVGGGTVTLDRVRRALEVPVDRDRPRCVVIFTNGFSGNEAQVIAALRGPLRSSRVLCVGVGESVDGALLERLARLGQDGAVAHVGPGDSGAGVIETYFERVRRPAMTGISIDWGGANVAEVFPGRCPDLAAGRPVVLSGRFTGGPPKTVRVSGIVEGESQELEVAAESSPADAGASRALPWVWARMKIADLVGRAAFDAGGDYPRQIRRIALDYGLVSGYTAFVTVDSLTRTPGEPGASSEAPPPNPAPAADSVRQETQLTEPAEGRE